MARRLVLQVARFAADVRHRVPLAGPELSIVCKILAAGAAELAGQYAEWQRGETALRLFAFNGAYYLVDQSVGHCGSAGTPGRISSW